MTSDLSGFENELYTQTNARLFHVKVFKVQMNKADSVSRSYGSLNFEVKKKEGRLK
jgi:hypothetical protein